VDIKEFAAKDTQIMTDAFVKGNLDRFHETHATDVVSHMPPFPDVKGGEAYKQFIIDMHQAFTITQLNWDETITEGNTIAHRFTMRMKHTGEYPAIPVPPTGKEVVITGGAFLHVKDDKIVEAFQYGDWLGMMQQLGAVPSQ
jgi:predicted ester cyclase